MIRLPVIFVGHGSPYNLFNQNSFTRSLNSLGKKLFKQYSPDAIVIISAHWLTKGTFITGNDNPKMIYDYYNFPQEFYEYIYPGKGSSKTAEKITQFLPNVLKISDEWGIDHAATILLENMIPSGEIPIIELSLDIQKPPQYHFELGQKLAKLREENILFIGSGNLIHTFRELNHDMYAEPFDWVIELDSDQKQAIDSYNIDSLINYEKIPLSNRGFQTNDHYLPMLYIMGMKQENEDIRHIYEGFQHGSASHRSFIIE